MMRVGVDLLSYTGTHGGTETYIRQVLPRIAALLPGVEFVGIVNATGRERIATWFPGTLRSLPISGENRPIWAAAETLAVAPVVRRLGADLLWCPANVGPRWSAVPRLVTLHDVIPFEYPNSSSWIAKFVTKWIISGVARGARRVVTDSQSSADAIVRVLGIDRERITLVPLAASSPTQFEDSELAAELSGFGLGGGRPYVLSTGNRLPHKNFDGLLRAVATIPADRRPTLVITGSHGADRLQAVVDELGLAGDVVLPGWVTLPQLEALFRGAALYVCPSLAEGFGLPVLDAMQRGVPVLASDVLVLREVGGDAAAYVNTRDPVATGTKIGRIVADPLARAVMRAAGLERVVRFSWDKTAEQTATVIAELLGVQIGTGP